MLNKEKAEKSVGETTLARNKIERIDQTIAVEDRVDREMNIVLEELANFQPAELRRAQNAINELMQAEEIKEDDFMRLTDLRDALGDLAQLKTLDPQKKLDDFAKRNAFRFLNAKDIISNQEVYNTLSGIFEGKVQNLSSLLDSLATAATFAAEVRYPEEYAQQQVMQGRLDAAKVKAMKENIDKMKVR